MLNLVLVGCGGMGCRHIRGLHRLKEIDALPFTLAGVVDIFEPNRERAASLAEELLGHRPQQFDSFDAMQEGLDRIDAMVVTTMPNLHAEIGIAALEAGIDVMVEKPIALTTSQGIALVEVAAQHGRKLAVAENYRRDPINRLAKALLDAGAIGPVHLFIQSSSGSGERVIITPWRHRRESGGIVVDMGIHYADLMEYFVGPIETVYGLNGIVDEERIDAEGTVHPADAEDLSVGVCRFANGAIGNYLIDCAGRGQGHFQRVAYGRKGSLAIPADRTGKPLTLTVREGILGADRMLVAGDVLALVPDFHLDEVTIRLFGGDRLTSYDLPFETIDANLLAIEHADFADAILNDRQPEVDGAFGLRSLAIAYGFIEAELEGRALAVNDLVAGVGMPYQTALDAQLSSLE
ncbi:MAG: Gfo/Idh/MocA family oxidoreductase [Thermomicrobiales bacterium]